MSVCVLTFSSFPFVFVLRAGGGTKSPRGPRSPIEVLRFSLFRSPFYIVRVGWAVLWIYLRFVFCLRSCELPARCFLLLLLFAIAGRQQPRRQYVFCSRLVWSRIIFD